MAERTLNIKPSSNVKGAVYDDESQRLTVSFHSGHGGYYEGVDDNTAGDFERAESSGKFVATVLKPGFTYKPL